MLGKTLKDPHGVEAGGEMKGIGLLDTDTVFTEKKTRTRVTGRFKKVGGILQKSQALPEKRKVRQKQMASVMEMFMEHMYMEFLKKKK